MAADPSTNSASSSSVDPENSSIYVKTKHPKQMKSIFEDENNSLLAGNGNEGVVFGTPRAKNVTSIPRKVLGEKTPNNGKRPLSILSTSPTKTPSQLNNSLNLTPPLAHPTLKNIAVTTKTLTNPPDLFLQPQQKRRSVRHAKLNNNEKGSDITSPIQEQNHHQSSPQSQPNHLQIHVQPTTKLVTVFPSTSDDLDSEELEIEKPAGGVVVCDDGDDNCGDSINSLSGTSTIIPNLELHEKLDFTRILSIVAEGVAIEEETEKEINIEPVFIDFVVKDEDEENQE